MILISNQFIIMMDNYVVMSLHYHTIDRGTATPKETGTAKNPLRQPQSIAISLTD